MTPNWPWTLSNDKCSAGTKDLRLNFWSILLYDHCFSRYKVARNRKCTEWPQTELEHLTVKRTLYTLNAYPWSPNFGLFRSTISRFQDTCTRARSAKNWNYIEWPHPELEHLTVRSTIYTQNTYPWGPKFCPFRCTISRFRYTTLLSNDLNICTLMLISIEAQDAKQNREKLTYLWIWLEMFPYSTAWCHQ